MNEILALMKKDLRLLLRDKAGFFFTFIMPVMFCVMFGAMFNFDTADAKIDVCLVDEDKTEGSATFVDKLKDSDELLVAVEQDRGLAGERVRRGKTSAYIILPEGFGASQAFMLWGDGPKLEVGIDPSRKAEAGMLQGVLTKHLFSGMGDMFKSPEKMRGQLRDSISDLRAADDMDPVERAALLAFLPALDMFLGAAPTFEDGSGVGFQAAPVQITDITRLRTGPSKDNGSGYAISFPQGIMWGVISCSAAFAISLVIERNRGTLVRLCTAPISKSKVLMGKAGACFTVNWMLQALLLTLAIVVFGVRPSSYAMLALAITCVTSAFVGMMMTLSVIGKTEQAAAGIGWAVFLVMAMVGGAMVPRLFMPSWMKSISAVSPVRWSIEAMEGAIWRGYSFGEMVVPCMILLSIGIICFVVGARLFQWSEA